MLTRAHLGELLAAACAGCGGRSFLVRALGTGRAGFLDGEPVSSVGFEREAPPPERVYRVECAACGAAAFARDDCPLCRAPGGLQRALGGRHGLAPPARCPRCGDGDLTVEAEVRMHALAVHGAVSRRVADAEPHEAGFHAVRVECPTCEATVADAPSSRCPACGRSSLVRLTKPH